MVSRKMIFHHVKGLHLRPASELCKIAMDYPCHITIHSKNKTMNAKSVLGILGAGIHAEDEMEIFCEGDKEQEALEKITAFLLEDSNFD